MRRLTDLQVKCCHCKTLVPLEFESNEEEIPRLYYTDHYDRRITVDPPMCEAGNVLVELASPTRERIARAAILLKGLVREIHLLSSCPLVLQAEATTTLFEYEDGPAKVCSSLSEDINGVRVSLDKWTTAQEKDLASCQGQIPRRHQSTFTTYDLKDVQDGSGTH